jgi:hypothetical protein
MSNYEASLADLRSVLDLKKENTDTYSNSTYLLTLAEIMLNSDLDTSEFKGVIEGDLTPVRLAEEVKAMGIKNKYPPSIIQANLFLAKLSFNERPEDAIPLLSEAKQVAQSNNRRRDFTLIKQFADNIGLDMDTL